MDFRSVVKLLYAIVTIVVPEVTSYSTASAESLYTALTYGYNNLVRPSGTTQVNVSLGILSVNFLDVRSQQFSVTGWLDVTWTDSRFAWNPVSYSSISEMYLDYTYCWNPRILVDNAMGDATILADSALLFKIDDAGLVTWSPSGEFTVHCPMDVGYYPYDVQSCFISVKSWSFPATAVTFTYGGIYTNQFSENDEWEMTSYSVTLQDVQTNGVAYSNIQFKFKMTRRWTTILVTFVIPLVLISFLSMFVFMVPAECNSKLGFPIAVLIAEVIQLHVLLELTPTSARSIPVLGTYVLLLVSLSVLEIFLTILIVKLYYNKDRNRPVTDRWERIAAVLYAITCHGHVHDHSPTAGAATTDTESASVESPQDNECSPELKKSIKRRLSIKPIRLDCSFTTSRNEEFQRTRRRSKAWDDSSALCCVDRKYTWRHVSSAVDRVCFIVFMLLRLTLAVISVTIVAIGSS